MSFFTPGFSFQDGVQNQCSYTALHALVDAGTVTAIGATEFATAAHYHQINATIPGSDQGEGSLWFDTTLNLLRVKDNTRWDCQYVGPELLAASAGVAAGMVVISNGNNGMDACATSMWPETNGICVTTVAQGQKSLVRRTGLATVYCVGPLAIGDTITSAGNYQSWSIGAAASVTAIASASTVTGGIEIGFSLGSIVGITTGLVTCMICR